MQDKFLLDFRFVTTLNLINKKPSFYDNILVREVYMTLEQMKSYRENHSYKIFSSEDDFIYADIKKIGLKKQISVFQSSEYNRNDEHINLFLNKSIKSGH